MVVLADIPLNQITNKYFIKMFHFLNVPENLIPSPPQFRQTIITYGNYLTIEILKLFQNKRVPLILDRTTSWNQSLYQISIYYPNLIRHHFFIHIEPETAQNVIEKVCSQLSEKNIEVIDGYTNNATNLVSFFKRIQDATFSNKNDFLIIRFVYACDTAQLIIKDLKDSSSLFKEKVKATSKLISWIKKKERIFYCKNNGLKSSPPQFIQIRWNPLFYYIIFVLNNYGIILKAINFFSNSLEKSPVELNDEIKNQLISMLTVLGPIIKFTNRVQKNFITAGEVFYEMLKFQTETQSITSPDTYEFFKL